MTTDFDYQDDYDANVWPKEDCDCGHRRYHHASGTGACGAVKEAPTMGVDRAALPWRIEEYHGREYNVCEECNQVVGKCRCVECPACGGSGYATTLGGETLGTCDNCRGDGFVTAEIPRESCYCKQFSDPEPYFDGM